MFTIIICIVIFIRTFSNHLLKCLLLCLSCFLLQFLPDDEEAASLFTIVIDKEMSQQEKKKKTASDMGRFLVSSFSTLGSLSNRSTTVFSMRFDLCLFVFCICLDHTGPVVSGWDCIKLDYDVQWPLHILFQPVVLNKLVIFIVNDKCLFGRGVCSLYVLALTEIHQGDDIWVHFLLPFFLYFSLCLSHFHLPFG